MHRIRLHGPWNVRIFDSGPEKDGAAAAVHERAAELTGHFLPASNSESQPNSAGGLVETIIRFPEDWDRWCDSNLLRPDQSVELNRRFGRPTGLTEGQEVWLVVDSRCERGPYRDYLRIWLNDELLEAPAGQQQGDSSFRISVRTRLLVRNQLRLRVRNSEKLSPSFRAIYLEICQ